MPKHSKDLPAPKWLNIEDFKFLCFDFAQEFMTYFEPIPDYATRDNNLLESALASPNQAIYQKLLYPTLPKQATILFYSLIKNHPFKNGNKRIAVMSLLAFLGLNKKWISINSIDLYKLAYDVSNSDTKEKDRTLKMIEKIITKHLIDFPQSNT